MKNKIIVWLLFFAITSGCSDKKLFFEKPTNNVLVCDTMYNENLRTGYHLLSIFQHAPGTSFTFKDKTYYEFDISTTKKFLPVMLSSQDEKILLVSKRSLLEEEDYRNEVLLDLNSKVGDTWNISQGGLLGNSHYILDSISSSGDLYYLSLRYIIEVDDAIFPYQIVLSRKEGIKQIALNVVGDSTICRCK